MKRGRGKRKKIWIKPTFNYEDFKKYWKIIIIAMNISVIIKYSVTNK